MSDQIVNILNEKISGCLAESPEVEFGDRPVLVDYNYIKQVCTFLKNDSSIQMNVLQVITGCDYDDRIEVSYILASFLKNSELILKTKLMKNESGEIPNLESVCELWEAANFQERECYDMLGVAFDNHPDLRRILCPDDWEGFPLRKDYQAAEKYNGLVIYPKEKSNDEHKYFYKKVQDELGDPKKVMFSWKK